MTVTLVLPDQIAAELLDAAAADLESACVLLARHVEDARRRCPPARPCPALGIG